MTAEDFASRICAEAIRSGLMIEDGEPHRRLFEVGRAIFRDIWEQLLRDEIKADVIEPPSLPVRVEALPSRE